MNTHDADIVVRDPTLPGLGLLLDERSLLAALRTLPGLRDIRTLRITYLRYKPATSCVAGLRVIGEDGQTRHYFAKALTAERFKKSWRHPRRQALVAAGDPCAPLALADKALMLQHPACDTDIRYLSLLGDEMRPSLLRELFPLLTDPHEVGWRFLRYKPERRAVIALSRNGAMLGVLRIASKNEFGRILQGSAVGAALGHISLLASRGASRMLVTGWHAGVSLGPEHGGTLASDDMSAAGMALATLHQTPFRLPGVRRADDDIRAMWRVFNTFEVILPDSAARFQQIAQRITRFLSEYRGETTLIHGDFSADQLIKPEDGGLLRIIDWDRCACGCPLADLASFVARLEMQAISGMITSAQAHGAMAAFQHSYASQRDIDVCALRWYSAWALLCLAAEPFRRRVADWPRQTLHLLDRVGQLVEEAQRSGVGGAESDPRMMSLCDPSQIGPALAATLKLPVGYSPPFCRLLRYKPGRRALVEYQWPSFGTLLGKYRYKGVDRHGYQCQLALWQHGFCGKADVVVPQPLGVLPEWHLWLQEKTAAVSLTVSLRPDNPSLAALGDRVGRALVAVQQSDALAHVAAAKRWHLADELAVLATGLEKVAARYPHWQSRLRTLFADCTTLAQRLSEQVPGCTHRDFYPDQVMLSQGDASQLVMLDFDLCCLSFPALDVGNYLAHIRELALRRYRKIDALALHEQAFVNAWLAATPGGSLVAVRQFATLSLARHIFLSTQFDDRAHTTMALLKDCEQQLKGWLTKPDRDITTGITS